MNTATLTKPSTLTDVIFGFSAPEGGLTITLTNDGIECIKVEDGTKDAYTYRYEEGHYVEALEMMVFDNSLPIDARADFDAWADAVANFIHDTVEPRLQPCQPPTPSKPSRTLSRPTRRRPSRRPRHPSSFPVTRPVWLTSSSASVARKTI